MASRGTVSTKSRPKALALWVDSEEILTFLWCCDEYTFKHPRIMIQLSFFILVASYWGLRPGEIVESSSHRGSNEGIQYGDVSLSLCRNQESEGLRYQLDIAIRNRKFARQQDGKV